MTDEARDRKARGIDTTVTWASPRGGCPDSWNSPQIRESAPSESKEPTEMAEQLTIEIARELYDRFVMGGWEPPDAYPQIGRWLNDYAAALRAEQPEQMRKLNEECAELRRDCIALKNSYESVKRAILARPGA